MSNRSWQIPLNKFGMKWNLYCIVHNSVSKKAFLSFFNFIFLPPVYLSMSMAGWRAESDKRIIVCPLTHGGSSATNCNKHAVTCYNNNNYSSINITSLLWSTERRFCIKRDTSKWQLTTAKSGWKILSFTNQAPEKDKRGGQTPLALLLLAGQRISAAAM